jgi:hypothetical protein
MCTYLMHEVIRNAFRSLVGSLNGRECLWDLDTEQIRILDVVADK